jgi:hypothetical protein
VRVVVAVRIGETYKHLVEHHLVEHLDVFLGTEPLGEPAGEGTAALDGVDDAAAAEGADRGVDRESPRPARELRVVVHLVALATGTMDEVAGPDAHGRAVRRRVGTEHDAGVIGHVQPLVRVGRP